MGDDGLAPTFTQILEEHLDGHGSEELDGQVADEGCQPEDVHLGPCFGLC